MSPADTPRAKNLALALLAMAQFVVVLDASITNVALPSIGEDLGLLPGQPLLGRELVHARLRRLPAAGRPPRRPARPPPHVHLRHVAVRGRIARRRPRSKRRLARGRTRGPGPRRGADLPRRAGDRDHHLRRGRRAQQGAGRLGRRRRLRRRRGCAPRRRAHREPRLGVGPVRERADRHRGGADRPAAARRVERPLEPVLRHRRRVLGHGRPGAARLHARRRQQRGLGVHPDARAGRRRGGAARRVRRDRAAYAATRWCRSRSSGCARSGEQT